MKKVSAISLVTTALLLLAFFVVLFLSIRPDPDDMIISLDIREQSLYYALKMRYLLSSFRTTLIVSDAFVLGSNDASTYPVRIFVYYAGIFLLLIGVLYGLLKNVLSPGLTDLREKMLLLCLSTVGSGAIYFLCSDRIEVFGWLGASEGHLVPMVFVLLALLILLKPVLFWLDLFLLGISALVIAGGAEHINFLLIFLNIYFLYLVFRKRSTIVSKKKILHFAIFHFLCFAVFFSNPGVWHRVHDVNVAQIAPYDPGNFFAMFFQPYKLVGAFLAMYTGVLLRIFYTPSRQMPSLRGTMTAGAIIFLVCFSMGLAAYHTYALGRIWFPFDVFLCFCFFSAGLQAKLPPVASFAAGTLCVLLVSAHAYRHIPALIHFRKHYDEVVELVKSADAGEEVIIKHFPDPDLVNLVELNSAPDDQLNLLFCRFYGSKAKISVHPDHSKSR